MNDIEKEVADSKNKKDKKTYESHRQRRYEV